MGRVHGDLHREKPNITWEASQQTRHKPKPICDKMASCECKTCCGGNGCNGKCGCTSCGCKETNPSKSRSRCQVSFSQSGLRLLLTSKSHCGGFVKWKCASTVIQGGLGRSGVPVMVNLIGNRQIKPPLKSSEKNPLKTKKKKKKKKKKKS